MDGGRNDNPSARVRANRRARDEETMRLGENIYQTGGTFGQAVGAMTTRTNRQNQMIRNRNVRRQAIEARNADANRRNQRANTRTRNFLLQQMRTMNQRVEYEIPVERETIEEFTLPRLFRTIFDNYEDQVNEGMLIQFRMSNGDRLYRTIVNNGNMRNNVQDLVDGLMNEEQIADESDRAYQLRFDHGHIQTITFQKIPIAQRGRQRGEFWRWTNNTKFDLSRYGVYHDIDVDNYTDNCFTKALRLGIEAYGQNASDAVAKAKVYMEDNSMPIRHLSTLAEEIGICFQLKRGERYEYFPKPFYDTSIFYNALKMALQNASISKQDIKKIFKSLRSVEKNRRIYEDDIKSLFTKDVPTHLNNIVLKVKQLVGRNGVIKKEQVKEFNKTKGKITVDLSTYMQDRPHQWLAWYKNKISIGLIDEHYFINDEVDFTNYAFQNYFTLIDDTVINGNVDAMRYITDETFTQKPKRNIKNSYDVLYDMYIYEAIYIHVDPQKTNVDNMACILDSKSNKFKNKFKVSATGMFDYRNNGYERLSNIVDKIAEAKRIGISRHYMKSIPLWHDVFQNVKAEEHNDSLEYIDTQIRKSKNSAMVKENNVEVAKMMNLYNIWFFDFETYRETIEERDYMGNIKFDKNGKPLTMDVTLPYQVCVCNADKTYEKVFTGKNCAKDMLDYVWKHSHRKKHPDLGKSGKLGEHASLWEKKTCHRKMVIMVAHNCGFDLTFVRKYFKNPEFMKRGNRLIRGPNGFLYGFKNQKNYKNQYPYNNDFEDRRRGIYPMHVEFVDSLNFIQLPLKKFPDMFHLESMKEIMPYELYTGETIRQRFVDISKARNYLSNDAYEQLNKNITELDLWDNTKRKFDILEYSAWYCRQDVNLLRLGYLTYRNWCIRDYDIDINKVWTGSSLAHLHFKMKGCYDDVYEMGGRPQEFIQKCLVGGRTMCHNNEMQLFENTDDHLLAIDFVSLYPTAVIRMKGFLKGKPKVLQPDQLTYEFLQQQDGYFVKIKVTKVGKHLNFALLSQVSEDDGIRIFNNDMVNRYQYVDKTTLEDYITFQQVEFKVICGYYFDEGRNSLNRETMRELFAIRLKQKKEKNPAQAVTKLIANSQYGRTLMKRVEHRTESIPDKQIKSYLYNNFHKIKDLSLIHDTLSLQKDEGEKYWDVKILNTKSDGKKENHFNHAQVGVEILSMSKRIMNEVMAVAELMDNPVKIFYQDTDSCFIRESELPRLLQEHAKRYNKEWFVDHYGHKYRSEIEPQLLGKYVGQLHDDFDIVDANGEKITCTDVKATRAIFLGKKAYVCHLRGINKETKEVETCYKVRMKGIPTSTLWYTHDKMKAEGKIENMFDLYKILYDKKGELNPKEDDVGYDKSKKGLLGIVFDLTEGGSRVRFKFHKTNNIEYLKEFSRFVTFDQKK